LAHTFRVYRALKKTAQDKNKTLNVSEIQITREFLLAGKLHRALTFGLDVPSLLFADASGQECGTGTSKEAKNPNQVLEERLYHTPLLRECELDYNRMLAHRLVRALLPKVDSTSPVAMALVVEIFAGFVLFTIMGLWIPSFLNYLIITLMDEKENVAATSPDAASQARMESPKKRLARGNINTNAAARAAPKQEETRTSLTNPPNSRPIDILLSNDSILKAPLSTAKSADSFFAATSVTSNHHTQIVEDPVGDLVLKLMASALDELQKHLNFDDCRRARYTGEGGFVDWDSSDCQAAVLRLVMLIEAVLLHGRCVCRRRKSRNDEETQEEAATFSDSLPQLLMEMTSEMDEFDAKIVTALQSHSTSTESSTVEEEDVWEPHPDEISTLRTLISTWLHSGQLSRAIFLMVKGFEPAFSKFFTNEAFLAIPENADTFAELMNNLNGVEIMVETMAVLSSRRLDLEIESSTLYRHSNASNVSHNGKQPKAWTVVKSATARVGPNDNWTLDPTTHFGAITTPRHLDFHKNSGFASSLREERERRMRSWKTRPFEESILNCHRKFAKAEEQELHAELHHLAKLFYNATNFMSVRDASRKSGEKVALVTAETISNRRRIEVPDDDSSFLLRAQVSCKYIYGKLTAIHFTLIFCLFGV
jgi:hypothetical protein